MSRLKIILISATAVLAAAVPLLIALNGDNSNAALIVALINVAGWSAAAVLYLLQEDMLNSVNETFADLSLSPVEGNLAKQLDSFLSESKRYHRASYAFRSEGAVRINDLGINLQRIVALAYHELGAASVELALFDEGSGLWSQALLVGEPTQLDTQAMLADASASVSASSMSVPVVDAKDTSEAEAGGESAGIKPEILVQSVVLADTMLGQIRVEMPEGVSANESDRQVLHLLATQGALMLVNARFTDELLRMKSISEESLRAKTGFLANLSHELRGPLGTILNGVELILDGLCGPTTDVQEETLEMIKESGDHLLDLVNDVLDYAKVEAGKVTPKPVVLGVKELVNDMAAVVRSQAAAKQHRLSVLPVEDDLGMLIDRRHSRQILINLLTNAIKYTPDGGEITLSAERVSNGRLRISVQDNGIGIPDSEKSKVFGAFERVDNNYAMAQIGTGLGMALTQRLVQVNEGSIGFDSVEGEGSKFWFVMPAVELEPDEGDQLITEVDDSVQACGQGERILLVEHDEQLRQMLELYLENQGFEILTASSGTEVLDIINQNEINLAVVENDLPDLPGEEVVATMRASERTASIPIVLLSARAFLFDIERFLKLGVDRCLSKPVSLGDLALTSRRLIDEKKALDERSL